MVKGTVHSTCYLRPPPELLLAPELEPEELPPPKLPPELRLAPPPL